MKLKARHTELPAWLYNAEKQLMPNARNKPNASGSRAANTTPDTAASTDSDAISSSDPQNFVTLLSKLENVVQTMEDGQLDLEQSLQQYSAGVTLAQQCQRQLKQAELQVAILQNNPDGQGQTDQSNEQLQAYNPTTNAELSQVASKSKPEDTD